MNSLFHLPTVALSAGSSVVRRTSLAVVFAICALALFAQAAGAAATLNASTDSTAAGDNTVALTINTALSGFGNAKKQYGARVVIPPQLNVQAPALGSSEQRCPASSFSTLNTGITPTATAFNNASCPATAKIGTATLGSASGGIYLVNISALPQMGVYFDTGVGTAYGRKLSYAIGGSNESTLQITGLPNQSTNGLTLVFDNPARATLPTKSWGFVTANDPACDTTQQATGNVWTWPWFGTSATVVGMAGDDLPVVGCGIGFVASTDTTAAGDNTVALTLQTPLAGTGNNLLQYGASFIVPPQLNVQAAALGSSGQRCSAGSFSSLSTGITPIATAFSNAGCPAEAKVGTATLGGASGSIYVVNTSPFPQFGVYFDTGVVTAFGRKLSISFGGQNESTMTIMGLPDQETGGLSLTFDNPGRPTLATKIWGFVGSGDGACVSTDANGDTYTYPNTGTAADVTQRTDDLPITGC